MMIFFDFFAFISSVTGSVWTKVVKIMEAVKKECALLFSAESLQWCRVEALTTRFIQVCHASFWSLLCRDQKMAREIICSTFLLKPNFSVRSRFPKTAKRVTFGVSLVRPLLTCNGLCFWPIGFILSGREHAKEVPFLCEFPGLNRFKVVYRKLLKI